MEKEAATKKTKSSDASERETRNDGKNTKHKSKWNKIWIHSRTHEGERFTTIFFFASIYYSFISRFIVSTWNSIQIIVAFRIPFGKTIVCFACACVSVSLQALVVQIDWKFRSLRRYNQEKKNQVRRIQPVFYLNVKIGKFSEIGSWNFCSIWSESFGIARCVYLSRK